MTPPAEGFAQTLSPDPVSNELLSTIFQILTAAGGELTAVTPRDAFVPYFSFEWAVGRYGSDGTRTRDLRRDRPAF